MTNRRNGRNSHVTSSVNMAAPWRKSHYCDTLLHFGWKLLININIFFSFATMGRERKSKLWFMRKLSSTLEKTWHAAFNSTANMKRFILDWWVNLENCYFSSSWKRQNVVYWLHLRFACGFLSLLGIEGVPYFLMFFLCTSHEESFQCKLPFYLLRPFYHDDIFNQAILLNLE